MQRYTILPGYFQCAGNKHTVFHNRSHINICDQLCKNPPLTHIKLLQFEDINMKILPKSTLKLFYNIQISK